MVVLLRIMTRETFANVPHPSKDDDDDDDDDIPVLSGIGIMSWGVNSVWRIDDRGRLLFCTIIITFALIDFVTS